VVAAVHGIEICSSFARFCDHCMERRVKHTVDGELREELQLQSSTPRCVGAPHPRTPLYLPRRGPL
jgi:hypothetical protein